jgi:hypothetical protein
MIFSQIMFKKGLVFFSAMFVFGAVFYLFFTKKQDVNSFKNTVIQKDNIFEVKLKSLDLNLSLVANFTTIDTFKLSFKVGGFLEKGETEIELGTSFKKNQLLFQINNRSAFLHYLQVKNQFHSDCDDAISILENILSLDEITKWKSFSSALKENQLIADFPVIRDLEEQKVIQNLELSKKYNELKTVESSMSNYFYLAPFEGKVLKLYTKVGAKIQKNQSVAMLIPKNSKILQVIMDSSEFNKIVSVQKLYIESTNFIQNLDWSDKTVVYNGSKVTLFFKDKSWNRLDINKVFRFELKGKTGIKYAWIPSSFIQNNVVKSMTNKSAIKVFIRKSLQDSSLVAGLKPGMKIMQ